MIDFTVGNKIKVIRVGENGACWVDLFGAEHLVGNIYDIMLVDYEGGYIQIEDEYTDIYWVPIFNCELVY